MFIIWKNQLDTVKPCKLKKKELSNKQFGFGTGTGIFGQNICFPSILFTKTSFHNCIKIDFKIVQRETILTAVLFYRLLRCAGWLNVPVRHWITLWLKPKLLCTVIVYVRLLEKMP